jgi:hypothetical protein
VAKPKKPRDPHLAHIVCLNKKCGAVYDLAPVKWTADGGYYSSDREFCTQCGLDQLDVSYPWLVKKTTALLKQMKSRLGELSAPQMRSFILGIYNVLWNPPDKGWSADTFDEIVAVFQTHQLVPNMEDADE